MSSSVSIFLCPGLIHVCSLTVRDALKPGGPCEHPGGLGVDSMRGASTNHLTKNTYTMTGSCTRGLNNVSRLPISRAATHCIHSDIYSSIIEVGTVSKFNIRGTHLALPAYTLPARITRLCNWESLSQNRTQLNSAQSLKERRWRQ